MFVRVGVLVLVFLLSVCLRVWESFFFFWNSGVLCFSKCDGAAFVGSLEGF